MKKFLYICMAVLLILMLFYWTRYQVIPGPHGFYKINRLTGKISAIQNRTEREVSEELKQPIFKDDLNLGRIDRQ